MEEIKSMLVKLCDDVKRLSEGQDELTETVKRLDEGQNEIRKEMAEGLSKVRQDILDEVIPKIRAVEGKLFKEIRAVNERLAACQLVNGKKVDVLFDADETRRQLLEIHDEEIPEIKSTLFNYDIRIKNLESNVIGS